MRILFTETNESEAEFFRSAFPSDLVRCTADTIAAIAPEELSQVEALSVFLGSHVDATVMHQLPMLKRIATRSTGFDHIDLFEAEKRGIAVFNVPEYGSTTVAEHTFGLILSLTRRIHKAYVRTLLGEFHLEGLMGTDLAGKTLGVVGLGKIGHHVARIGDGFDMKILAYDPIVREAPEYVRLVPLDKLLAGSDVIAVCCPFTPGTYHLIGESALRRIKRGAILVNTARGPIVDTKALLTALSTGRLSGAALDVLEGEELMTEDAILANLSSSRHDEVESIARNLALMRHPNLIVTPHMAFYSQEALQRIRETTVDNLLAEAPEEAPNRVRPTR
jgi:D-lactate dehydrogenase